MDFTVKKYRELLVALQNKGYIALTFNEYLQQSHPERFIILRHDVDKKPKNSLTTARLEASLGMKASYYFRAVPESWDEPIIKEITSLDHEVGYHYESLATCNGNLAAALLDFENNLNKLRELAPVTTICMHGSPRSQWDNRDIWKNKSYREFNIIGEPYLDTNFGDVLYLTDTGRCWDGDHVSRRDKIPQYQDEWTAKGWAWHTTPELIAAIRVNGLPAHVMITTHPQRWTNHIMFWWREKVLQNIKNRIKKLLVR